MDLPEAARLVEASRDFRLLRRVPAPPDWPLKSVSGETRRGVFVDMGKRDAVASTMGIRWRGLPAWFLARSYHLLMLPGIKRVASEELGMPVRSAQPENLIGLVDKLNSPAYSTGVGLLHWAVSVHETNQQSGRGRKRRAKGETSMQLSGIMDWIKRLLP